MRLLRQRLFAFSQERYENLCGDRPQFGKVKDRLTQQATTPDPVRRRHSTFEQRYRASRIKGQVAVPGGVKKNLPAVISNTNTVKSSGLPFGAKLMAGATALGGLYLANRYMNRNNGSDGAVAYEANE